MQSFKGNLSRYNIAKNGCWNWTGTLNAGGYGKVTYWHNGKLYVGAASRASFILHSKIKKRLKRTEFVCHTCDNKKCINPAHLYLGTAKTNARDASERGRNPNKNKKKCARGHSLNSKNTYMYLTKEGHAKRICRKCRNYYSWEAKKKSKYGARKWAKDKLKRELCKL